MSSYAPDKAGTIVPFAPTPKPLAESNVVADDSGRTIVALLQLRAAEERLREAEADAAHFRDRAARAEQWLLRIHNEVEQTFFQKKERDARNK